MAPLYKNLQTIFETVQRFVEINQKEWEAVLPYVEVQQLQKHDFLLKPGHICRKMFFLLSGYTRIYSQSPTGEVTRDINKPSTFLTALPSYISEKPSQEIIQCVTKVEVLIISKEHLEGLFYQFHNWERLGRLIIQEMYMDTQQRLYDFIHLTAEDRYRKLLKDHKDLMDHIPLGYIASFLGISPPSLSRIRKQLLNINTN
ncbi:Crp/Fnr family transcriptional regulator [Xanthovirga aplysinae]|uniref:Crp/Fnr family transcriptional regulator n=1 Tax=Xanthovirga aplysinae TaxID=2529853 RepID=UPI0012BCC394|nr:Crp/Fnr family transcriptional regulator [Xanthovirga aplysinae]MTI32573.1 Crp/Fnr family transcriptional regulator [Xanthovirga aplysinae]